MNFVRIKRILTGLPDDRKNFFSSSHFPFAILFLAFVIARRRLNQQPSNIGRFPAAMTNDKYKMANGK
jgi:hypothetical protein